MDSSSSPQRLHRASAMDAAAPFMALERRLVFPGFLPGADAARILAPGKEWARIDCSCKKAQGCGKHGEKLLEGIMLYVCTDYPYLTTTLSIFLNEEARRSIEAELKVGPHGMVVAEGAVEVATQQEQLMVMFVAFSSPHSSRRTYYLVYDAANKSLYMVPFIPAHIVCSYTTTPVPRFTGGAGSRDHELVLLARKFSPASLVLGGLVCVCSPATRANQGSTEFESESNGLWQVKPRLFPEVPYAFWPQQMFCFQGKLFWTDLAQGLMYCDLHTKDSFVKFDFISLPPGYLVRGLTESPTKRRTIGCIGSTIYFVYIDCGHRSCSPGDQIVKVWTLDMDHHAWKVHRGFPCPWKDIMGQGQAFFMGAGIGVRDVEPQYPVLMPGDALCLYLHQERTARESDYICSFDLHSKRPLWFGPVHDHFSASFILPTHFFVRNYNHPPPSKTAHKRKLEKRSANKQEECAKTCKPSYPSHSSRLSAREELK